MRLMKTDYEWIKVEIKDGVAVIGVPNEMTRD